MSYMRLWWVSVGISILALVIVMLHIFGVIGVEVKERRESGDYVVMCKRYAISEIGYRERDEDSVFFDYELPKSFRLDDIDTVDGIFLTDMISFYGSSSAYVWSMWIFIHSGYLLPINLDSMGYYTFALSAPVLPIIWSERDRKELSSPILKELLDIRERVLEQCWRASEGIGALIREAKVMDYREELIGLRFICNTEYTMVRLRAVCLRETIEVKNAVTPFIMSCEEWEAFSKEVYRKRFKPWPYQKRKMKLKFIKHFIEGELLTRRGWVKLDFGS